MTSDDPTVIRYLAITRDDVVTAYEANRRRDITFVLRVTPPFSGRMRARLHHPLGDNDTEAIHILPQSFLLDVPPYPTPDETADELRSKIDGSYSAEEHHKYHSQQVATWRETVRNSFVESLELPHPAGSIPVDIGLLD